MRKCSAAFVALMMLLGTVFASTASAETRTLTAVDVVALGDSFASGTGAGNYEPGTDGTCYRSANSYSVKVAEKLEQQGRLASFTNLTCSGATTDTVRQSQLGGVNQSTDLVLMSIGGNDAGFGPYAGSCITAVCSGEPSKAFVLRLQTMQQKVQKLLGDISRLAPHARIVLVGYGEVLEPTPSVPVPVDPICGTFSPQEHRDVQQVQGSMDGALNAAAMGARVLHRAKVTYVSPFEYPDVNTALYIAIVSAYKQGKMPPPFSFMLRHAFTEHSLCDTGVAWYRGSEVLVPGGEGQVALFHPTPSWHAEAASLVRV